MGSVFSDYNRWLTLLSVIRIMYRGWLLTWLPTTAAMEGFLLSPAGGWVTSAPRKMTGSLKIFGLMLGTRIELTPPSLTFILRHKFDKVCGDVLFTFFACTHCVAIPRTVSPTLFTSA